MGSLAGTESCLYDRRGEGKEESTHYNTSPKNQDLRAMTVHIAAAL
jgi:hypothetical protein